MRRVVAETMVENTASRRVMEKAGMTWCGKRIDVDGSEPVDLVVYEALADTGVMTR